MSQKERKVTERDFRQDRFRNADVEDYEFRDDGEVVRKDRWESAVHRIAGTVGLGGRGGFEIPDVIDAVIKATHHSDYLGMVAGIQGFFSRDKGHWFINHITMNQSVSSEEWKQLEQDGYLSSLSESEIKAVQYILDYAEADATEGARYPENPRAGQIPVYQCHKQVKAFEIGKIEGELIYPTNEGLCKPVEVSSEFINKHPLNEPGYLVIYNDDYVSYSPKEAFKAGYDLTLVVD